MSSHGWNCRWLTSGVGLHNVPSPSMQPGRAAADFSLPTLAGGQIRPSGLHGKVVVLDFWATWCPPCREGLPHLAKLSSNADLAQRGLIVVAVNEEEDPPPFAHSLIRIVTHSQFAMPVVRFAAAFDAS